MTSDDPGQPSDATADQDYARPPGVDDSFAPRESEPRYSPPPPTVSPEERAEFGRPAGTAAEFAPLPGERIPPAHRVASPPVSPGLSREYGRPRGADAFDPEPGSRITPRGRAPESPWWKPDARRDPWRDPRSPFWLGRPAVFAGGRPAQLPADEDSEREEEPPTTLGEEEELAAAPAKVVRGRFGLSALLLAVVVALVAGALGGGAGYWLANRAHGALHNGDVKLAKTGTPANRPPDSSADLAKRVTPAVVSIDIHSQQEDTAGSGIVIDKHGYILTNNHVVADVVADPTATMFVTFSDLSRTPAKLVGRDPKTDLAVIKVDQAKLTVASLGDSDKIAVGDPVIAIGSPLGLRSTVTEGIVSALDRPVPESDDPNGAILDAVQTDAAINEGNSGGALIDASGAVIGVNTAIATLSGANSGLGFAIPINQARPIAETIIHGGKIEHASIGLQARSSVATVYLGAFINQVSPEGPADQAGLKAGDVITMIDSTLIESSDRLTVVVQRHKPGDTVKVRYYRGNKESAVNVVLGTD
ncbi:MAG TPA: trypsin-like peptidase domain-containing protein [Jatrophihabitantaceae bacterium]|jgi:S1-C subfamily serine protease